MTLEEIDMMIHWMIVKKGAYPSARGLNGFKKSVKLSVNDIVKNGYPMTYRLKKEDYLKVEVLLFKDEFHANVSGMIIKPEVHPHI